MRDQEACRAMKDKDFQPSNGLRFEDDARLSSILLPVSRKKLSNSDAAHLIFEFDDEFVLTSDELLWERQEASGPAGARVDISADPASHGDGESALSLWSLEIQNNRAARLDSLTVNLLALADVPEDWFCTLPFGGGWAVRLADFPDGHPVSLRYPVQGCLQWLELWGEDEGITLQVRDGAPWLKDFIVRRDGNALHISVHYRHLGLEEGQALRMPPIALGAHKGDWQRGADVYAKWLQSVVPVPVRAPDWLQRAPGWAWVSGKGQYKQTISTTFADLPQRSETYASAGMPTIQLAAWFEHGHDTRYPDYVAGDSLGGEAGLRAASDAIRKSGRHLALYSNGRLFDPLSDCAQTHKDWKDWAIAAPEGKTLKESTAQEFVGVTTDVSLPDWDPHDQIAKEIYGQVTFATMCPSAPGWQELIAERLGRAVREYNPDGLYVDQVLGAVAVPCYSRGHQHRKPYESWMGYHRLLSHLRQTVKAANPDCYLATEGFSDILGQYFDLVQSHNDWPGPCPEGAFAFPEMTRRAVPWLMQAAGPVREDQFDMLWLAHVAGSGLDVACFKIAPDGEFARQIHTFMDWRARFGPDMYAGRPVNCWIAGMPGRRVAATRSSRIVICVSILDGSEGDARVLLDYNPGQLKWESTRGAGSVDPEASEDRWLVRIPAAPMAILWSDSHQNSSGD